MKVLIVLMAVFSVSVSDIVFSYCTHGKRHSKLMFYKGERLLMSQLAINDDLKMRYKIGA